MAWRLYFFPKVGTGSLADPIRPKYLRELGIAFAAMDYGGEAIYLAGAEVTTSQHIELAAHPDSLALPAQLDKLVGADAIPAIRIRLEGAGLPGLWVTSAMTYRQVLHVIGQIMQFAQRFRGVVRRGLFDGGVTLETLLNELTLVGQQDLRDVAISLQLDPSKLILTASLRDILRTVTSSLAPAVVGSEQL